MKKEIDKVTTMSHELDYAKDRIVELEKNQ